MKVVDEHFAGTCKLVDEFEDAYQASCKHNNTDDKDMRYFRRYVWNALAILSQQANRTEDAVFQPMRGRFPQIIEVDWGEKK